KFTNQSYTLAGGRGKEGEMRSPDMWTCPETGLNEEKLAPRTSAQLPPPPEETREWLTESETIVVMERSLLFCAAPNTGSLQFRMLAKRMQGVSHWSVYNNWSLLFDRDASELELLDTTDGQLMKEVYSDNGSGWIKIAVVRDPVTRLLSSYLDLTDTWRAGRTPQRQPSDNAPQQSDDHNRRRLWQWRLEAGPTDEDRRQGPGGGGQAHSAGTRREWEFFDLIVDRRRVRRQLQLGLRLGQSRGREGNAYEHFNESEQGGSGEARSLEGSGKRDGNETSTTLLAVKETADLVGAELNVVSRRSAHGLRQAEEQGQSVAADGGQPLRNIQNDDQLRRHGRPNKLRRASEHARLHRELQKQSHFIWEDPGAKHGDHNLDNDDVGDGGDAVRMPTFMEVLEALKTDVWSAPVAFRPVASLCGQRSSPFDSVIPFERLQTTSTEVVKSLPGDVWQLFGRSGWGPERKHAFMDFDYGRGAWRGEAANGGAGEAVGDGRQRVEGNDIDDPLPRHARDLFEGKDPCAWTDYYSDLETLDAVGMVYEMDYAQYRWYRLDLWKEKLTDCLAR
ncbi:unnamed protein product, partial [Ectocarpus fasciculatus]